MGRAARWLKGLLGMKNGKEHEQISNSDEKEKKRWSFAKPGRDCAVGNQIPVTDTGWLRSYIAETEKEQNKHAIAVAAATAAAADAAVAAAQAAVAVVRLTSNGRGTLFGGGRERLAAEKIQAAFRGHLARKALRALKGLVKLQALVRGYLVRKRANATLHSMRALIRAQTSARFQRARRSISKDNGLLPEIQSRKSTERFDDARNEFHSKRLFASYESTINAFDESRKIVEIDTFKPRSRSRRINTSIAYSESMEDPPCYYAVSSPLPCPIPERISVPDCRNLQHFDWSFTGDECRFSTAQSTPRPANSVRPNATATPSNSVCGDCYFGTYSNFPNYMANTKSFKAKLRSLSAPKQRPEPGPKKKLTLNELMAARNSISSVKMHRSSSQVQESLDF